MPLLSCLLRPGRGRAWALGVEREMGVGTREREMGVGREMHPRPHASLSLYVGTRKREVHPSPHAGVF